MIWCHFNLNILYSTICIYLNINVLYTYEWNVVCIVHIHSVNLYCIYILTLYIYMYKAFLGAGSCTIRYSTLYCVPVVGVSDVVNGEIKRAGRSITVCCIKSWWLIYKVFTFTILNKEQCDMFSTVEISYRTPVRINTTVKWLSVVSGDSYWWIWN